MMSLDLAAPRHIETKNLGKTFGGVAALRGIDVSFEAGQVHALVGQNGAGKSTLGKVIGGVHAPDSGELLVGGSPVHFRSPRQALDHGITMIEQELALVPTLSVLDNVFLGHEGRRGGLLQRSASLSKRFEELEEQAQFGLDPNRKVATLRIAERQKVEILRALSRDSDLIVMDEPTAALGPDDVDRLCELIRRLRDGGTTIVYVSHFLDEILSIADTITVLRDGVVVSSTAAAEQTAEGLVNQMLGEELRLSMPSKERTAGAGGPVLRVSDLTVEGFVHDLSFELSRGEILGLAGLVGSGRSEVLHGIFGSTRRSGGELVIEGTKARIGKPAAGIANGVSLLPESRKDEGLLLGRSIVENVILGSLAEHSRAGLLRGREEETLVHELAERLDIVGPGIGEPVATLSGGNQQKVLLARCLAQQPAVLLADEPTRGIDVAARHTIYEIIHDLAAQGTGVVLVSSDLEELLGLSHRVIVLHRGRCVAELSGDASEEEVMTAAFGNVGAGVVA